jgi:hypothetical protein
MAREAVPKIQSAALDDATIRGALVSSLHSVHRQDSETVILEELGLCRGQVRVDVVVVNGILHGYEIKSDRDSIHRLSRQASLYAKVLDRVTLVVGSRLLSQSVELVPHWWGVLHAHWSSGCFHFREIRAPRMNPGRDARALVELLWSDHAIALLEERKLARGVRGKPRRVVWDRICEQLDVDEIATVVRANLKARSMNRAFV